MTLWSGLGELERRPGVPAPALPGVERVIRVKRGLKPKRFPEQPTPWGLSIMEYQVALRIARGLTTEEAARELFISAKTASTYVTRAKDKMNALTIAHMAVIFDRWLRGTKPQDFEVVLQFVDGRPSVHMREASQS